MESDNVSASFIRILQFHIQPMLKLQFLQRKAPLFADEIPVSQSFHLMNSLRHLHELDALFNKIRLTPVSTKVKIHTIM